MSERTITWADVSDAWRSDSMHCADCAYQYTSHEPRPYGKGVALEHLRTCTLGDFPRTQSPDMCPATEHLKEEEE